jgi:hypothetical protein
MKVDVNHRTAKLTLENAIEAAKSTIYRPSSSVDIYIQKVFQHTHLTYKYILLTGLLAKTVDPRINPIALQAGSKLSGAYDARSLCHKVVVPIEQTILEKRLGGSNEPFLNKPARYKELSSENAVRRGKDLETLERLILIFGQINDQGSAKRELVYALSQILLLPSRTITLPDKDRSLELGKIELSDLFSELMKESCEGEVLTILVAVIFEFFEVITKRNFNIQSHPTNQSGASSKEVSDLDIFDGDKIIYCIEIKDKDFSESDIDHAVAKVISVGLDSLIFIYGPNVSYNGGKHISKICKNYSDKGFDLSICQFFDFQNSIVSLFEKIAISDVIRFSNKHLENTRAKEVTVNHFQNMFRKFFDR